MASVKVDDVLKYFEMAKELAALGAGVFQSFRQSRGTPADADVTLEEIQACRISKLEEEAAIRAGRERAEAES
jgi:hypothetical protein